MDGGRAPNGRRRQVTRSGFATRADAKAALADARTALAGGVPRAHVMSVGEYLETWLAGKRTIRPTTLESYRSHLDLYLLPHLGHLRLIDLRAHHLDALFAALAPTRSARPLSASTVRRVHATLRNALNAAVRRRLLAYNPANQIELPPERRTSIEVWTPTQVGVFLDHVEGERMAALFELVAMTGLRRGEACGLRWVDVDLDAGHLRVCQQLVFTNRGPHIGEPKTKKGARTVPLDANTTRLLRQHRKSQAAERLAWGAAWQDTGLVFTREDGASLRPEHVTRAFQAYAGKARLPMIRFHALRHTSASLALAAGVPMKVVSDRLGHNSTGITADLYTHVSPAVGRDAADRIAGLVPRRSRAKIDPAVSVALADDLHSSRNP